MPNCSSCPSISVEGCDVAALTLHSLADTATVAQCIAGLLQPGDIVLLHGEVGAGKTTFVRALCEALGVLEQVRSPTYTVAHLYELAGGRTIAHLDLYRDPGMLDAAGWADIEPYLEATYVCIEWPATAAAWLAGRRVWSFGMTIVDEHRRLLSSQAPDAPTTRILADAVASHGLVR